MPGSWTQTLHPDRDLFFEFANDTSNNFLLAVPGFKECREAPEKDLE